MADTLERFLGNSPWAETIRKRIPQVARYRYNVMLTGPRGTGKRLIGELIHVAGPRQSAPFVPVDCSHFSEATFREQMYGHEAGGSDSARAPALGCLRAAHGGTLLLARVDALPAELQSSLLEALTNKRIVPVGARQGVPIDVRVISSSRTELQKEVQHRRLIPDLYTHLDEVSLHTESLATHKEDLDLLVPFFLGRICEELELPAKRIDPRTWRVLKSYHWPGNVAELLEVIERAAVADDDPLLLPEHLDF